MSKESEEAALKKLLEECGDLDNVDIDMESGARLLEAFKHCYKQAYGSLDIGHPLMGDQPGRFENEVRTILKGDI